MKDPLKKSLPKLTVGVFEVVLVVLKVFCRHGLHVGPVPPALAFGTRMGARKIQALG